MDLTAPLPSPQGLGVETTLPHDDDAERALLGCLLLDATLADTIAETITGADFHQPAHEAVWDAVLQLHQAGASVDAILVNDHLRATGNGPVIPAGHWGLAGALPAGHVAALRWTGMAGDDRSMRGTGAPLPIL